MLKLLKSLFAEGREEKATAAQLKSEPDFEHKGFKVFAEAKKVSGQYQVHGRICKEIEGEVRTYEFIRADLCPSAEHANEMMLQKARTYIDQMGDYIFPDP